MADSQSQTVKNLNTSSGRRRFIFKSFSHRVEEIRIDIFRNLEPVKSEPSAGSSFFLEALLQWRELNTAEDFISLYEEMMPLVQTLPQILLHQEKIFSELLRRLHIGAKLSLEPILMLISALSRDILEEFLPFLQRFTVSLVDLLKHGGDRDPNILEQIFTAWSNIMMYLRKYLIMDVVHVLNITAHLRFFPKDYVQEFMAEAMSFLLRNSPANQLVKGIRKIISEIVKSSSSVSRMGVTALLWHTMKGTSSRLHSRAGKVLRLLIDNSTFSISDKFNQGSEAILEVITGVVHRICKEVDHKDLNLVYTCLYDEIYICITDSCLVHLDRLLYLLTFTVRQKNENNVFDSQAMYKLVRSLRRAYIVRSDSMKSEDHYLEVLNRVLQLMLCLLDIPFISGGLSSISLLYAPVFELRNSSLLLMFIKELLLKDPHIAYAFRTHIISAMDDLIAASPEEVIFLMLTFFERQGKQQSCDTLHGVLEDKTLKICNFFNDKLCYWFKLMRDIATKQSSSYMQVCESELAVLWGVLNCYPQFQHQLDNLSPITDLIGILDQLLETEADNIASLPKSTWQSLLGAALVTYHKLLLAGKSGFQETDKFLRLAKRHKSSPQVLFAVAEFLDSIIGSTTEADATNIFQELSVQEAVDSLCTFSDNLCLPNKATCVTTLRILSHYAPLNKELSLNVERPHKKLKTEESGSSNASSQHINVIELLLSVETTPVSISTSRKIIILISRIQMGLTSARVYDGYVPLLLNGIIGILHNRFSHLWGPAVGCLTTLISKYKELIWEKFIHYLGNYHLKFLSYGDQLVKLNSESSLPTNLNDCFNLFLTNDCDSTSCMTLITLLLQSLQKIPDIAESRSRQRIPLFFKFLGYVDADNLSIESFSCHKCKRKEWKSILKEWLNLLRLMRNAQSLYQSQILKEVLINRFLDEIDPDVQLKVLDCLLNWRDSFLTPYGQSLKNLIISKNLREELTTWNVSKESQYIQEGHRVHLIPIIVRLLTAKVRKHKVLATRKHAGVNRRRAVLYFLAQLDVDELQLFFTLLLKPLLPNLNCWSDGVCSKLSWKNKDGFLHVVEDILVTFDELRIKPFLNTLMGFVVRLLESCMSNLKNEDKEIRWTEREDSIGDLEINETSAMVPNPLMMTTPIKQLKDLRSLCLKIISIALNKYDNHDYGADFWDIFFMSVKPLIDRLKQESSSSERPSSLLSCFVAMSRSPMLVSLLDTVANLVPTIVSILTMRTATDAIISSVLNFIENLLNLDYYLNHQEDDSLKTLIHSFHGLFQSRKEIHRKTTIWPGKTELRIFKLLMKYISSPLAAEQLVDILFPFFKRKFIDSDLYLEGLCVIKGILSVSNDHTITKILNAMSPLLVSVGLDLRLCICDILIDLGLKDPSLAFLAKLLGELNAVSSSGIDGLDYDTRLKAYNAIRPELFSLLRVDHAVVILSHCVYDMSSEELIFRRRAFWSLLSFTQFASSVLNQDKKDCQEIMPHNGAHLATTDVVAHTVDKSTTWSKACIQRIIKRIFLQNMAEAMNKDVYIQKEWIDLLRHMVCILHGIPALSSLRPLCSEVDTEVDFFKNILDKQILERKQALARFRNVISAGNIAECITVKIFVPLFFNMLFNVKDGKGECLRDACVETLASIAGQMQWGSYRAFLMRCFREMTLKAVKQKILLRLICSILNKFHFYDESSIQAVKDGECEVNSGNTENISTALPNTYSVPNVPFKIQIYLQKAVVPQIQKLLTSDHEKVNGRINLAAIKVLQLLPMETFESQLPTIIHRISNFLKHRLLSIRDEARSVLAECVKELGLEYLHFILQILQGTLKRGYELHVLGYTLNFILSITHAHPMVGKLDYCLEELLSVAENDILGVVAEQKEVDKIASKMKETRMNKSFETLKLISQSITFRTHALKLLSPVNAHIQKHLTSKTKAKLETILQHIATGIEHNPSAELAELIIFVYGLIEDCAIEKDSCHDIHQSQNSFLIGQFALGLLHNRLKNMKLDKNNEHLLSMLDPFVKLLGDCLNSKREDILSATFGCLTPLISLPLPSLEAQADKIKMLVLEIAQRYGNANSQLVNSCLKLLTVLLQSTRISLSNDQLHLLIQFPMFIDLQTNTSPVALSLLKSIISRKLIVPEIYNLVVEVAELMVTSQSELFRKKCSRILMQFLLDYPLSNKCLWQHMNFLLTNLKSEHSAGREAVHEMLHDIIIKFPRSVLDIWAHKIFIHLVTALVSDRDHKVHSMVATEIKVLVSYTSQDELDLIFLRCLSWYMGEKQNMWGVAAQVLSLLVEVLKKRFQTHIDRIFQVAKNILKLSIDASTNRELDFEKESTIAFWKEAYYSLGMLEKMLIHFPKLYLDKEAWEMIVEFLPHPYIWLRTVSSRLVALYFASLSETTRVDHEKLELGKFVLFNPRRLFYIAVSFVKQLKVLPSDDATSNLVTQNLVFSVCGLHSFAKQRAYSSLPEFWCNLDSYEKGSYLETFDMLGSKKPKITFLLATHDTSYCSGEGDQTITVSHENFQSLLVAPILKKIGKLAIQMEDIQMKIVFNCFKMISSQIGYEGCRDYAIHILHPLYKVCEGFSGKVNSDEVKQLAEEVRDSIQHVLGVDNFNHVYDLIRKKLKEKRDKRKQQQKLIAAINTVRHSKRKLRIAEKHRAHKRRKITAMKMGKKLLSLDTDES